VHGGIVNPAKLTTGKSIAVCAQCHAGFGRFIDASPDDLLVANQVTAMQRSECFVQSRGEFSCISCHSAHGDSKGSTETAQKVCLGCHSLGRMRHAAICPVNAKAGCVGCHMPAVDIGPLHLVDHWVRVHPEQGISENAATADMRSQVHPVREYLRMIATTESVSADQAFQQLQGGASFYETARRFSKDPSAAIGGYLGERELSQLDPVASECAARLQYGERSGVIREGSRWLILERLPRDFRWQADQLLTQAKALRAQGDRQAALAKAQQAMMMYPQSLRGLTFIGTTLGEAGAIERAADVLRVATHLYPEDAQSLCDLALLLGVSGNRDGEVKAYRQAIALEPDFLAAYQGLSKALLTAGDVSGAVPVIRAGLQVNPLSAELYRALDEALSRTGDTTGAENARAVANAIDPEPPAR
jgi:predicted CXXCH cytochrome family protein